jgi:hypothetical protein
MHSFTLTLNDSKRISLASLGYAKRVSRSLYSERHQCQQCLCADRLRTPIFGRWFFQKESEWGIQENVVDADDDDELK